MQSNTNNLQKTNSGLFNLLFSVDFDKNRIVIAEHEFSENFLTIYLEDRINPKETIDQTLMYKLPVSQFAAIIKFEGLNAYSGIKFSESGRPYEAMIEVNEPIKWYNEDATPYQRKEALEAALSCILTSQLKGAFSHA